MTDRPRRHTDQVRFALEAQNLLPPPPPDLPALPAGQVRYHIAVDGFGQTAGQAPPAAVAAQLRALAHQLDPQGETNG